MLIKNNFSIGGRFKFDVFTKDDVLKSSTDYIDNFITATGLSYIQKYPLADCWRYLTLGSGSVPNTATGTTVSSTGLEIPLKIFSYLGGNNEHNSCVKQVNRYYNKGHGYTIGNTGITLFRTWRIPEDVDQFITGGYTFKEYGLSPGRPLITGWLFNEVDVLIPSGVCGCDAGIYSANEVGHIDYGRESYDYYTQYPNLCSSTKMFTRIVKDVTVQNDEYLLVTYGLSVNFPETGVSRFQVNVTRNSALGDYFNWVKSSGAFNIVHPGIRLINDGVVTSVVGVDQISNYEYRMGTSFNPPLGSPLELSCPDDNRVGYLSNDNLQFLANTLFGGAASYIHSVAPSGLMGFHKNWIGETSNSNSALGGKVATSPTFNTPRSETTRTFNTAYPAQDDINNAVNYEAIAGGNFSPTHLEPNVTSSEFDTLPFTGRTRARTISFQFKEPTLSENLPVRAFVSAYKSSESDYWYPSIDTLFFQTGVGGKTLSPPLDLPTRTYSNPYNAVSTFNGIGHYYMDSENILQIKTRITYSAPCPTSISGCPQ